MLYHDYHGPGSECEFQGGLSLCAIDYLKMSLPYLSRYFVRRARILVSVWFPPRVSVGIVLGAHLVPSCALCLSSRLPADFRGGYNQVCHSQTQGKARVKMSPQALQRPWHPGRARPGAGVANSSYSLVL